jgi:RNA polymerase sigma-70 factor (ECF subfamily)
VQAPENVDLMELAAAAEPSESIEDLIARNDQSRAVERAMAVWSDDQRTAIVLKEYHGLTFQEIADLAGCPLSTVKTRVYQGLTLLRRELAKSGQRSPDLKGPVHAGPQKVRSTYVGGRYEPADSGRRKRS